MATLGLILGFPVPLLQQLNAPGSTITIDNEEGSWLASLPGLLLFVGNFFVIPIMAKYGRRTANLVSIILLIIAWACIVPTPNITILFIARALQGINVGMSTTFGALLIGEYTSPKNRGGFLTIISVLISVAVLCSHIFSSYMTWQTDALVCAIITLIDMVIICFSPESPHWLASQGKYEEYKRVFRCLREDTEEEELNKIIEACIFARSLIAGANASQSFITKLKVNFIYFKATMRKKEFYKPLIIVSHIYTLMMWTGLCIVTAYPEHYIHRISGHDVNIRVHFVTTTWDVQIIVSNLYNSYLLYKKI